MRSHHDFYAACRQIMTQCNNPYAQAYARAGLSLSDNHEIKVQAAYIRSNLSHWRHPEAKTVKNVLDRIVIDGVQ